jgi:polyisoprenoid-binding protein YceI
MLLSLKKIKRAIPFLGMQLLAVASMAQVSYHAKNNLQLVVSGTSTMHDWSMKSAQGECSSSFTLNAAGQLAALTALSFTMPAESLKSDHSGMDKNAYKALKSSKSPAITYVLTSATLAPGNILKCQGKLTIAGVTKDAELVATVKLNADNSITVSGSKKLSMKDFSIDPPSFMLGTIKTGNDITLKFDLVLRK